MSGLVAEFRLDGVPIGSGSVARHLDQSMAGGLACLVLPPGSILTGQMASRAWTSSADPKATPRVRSDPSQQFFVAFDGRIDNRQELRRELGSPGPQAGAPDDLELLVEGFRAWGDGVFGRLVGPYSVILLDTVDGWIRIARDPLGARFIFFRHHGPNLSIASSVELLLKLAPATPEIDEESVARYLGVLGPTLGRTYFAGIEEVVPGEMLRFRAASRTRSRLSLAPLSAPQGHLADDDHAQRFRDTLDEVVRSRLSSASETGVLMSGGLDSTSVAATAARLLAASGSPAPVALSWTFTNFRQADESRWIEAAARHCRLRSFRVPSDDAWPLSDEESWPRFRDAPFLDVYWRIVDRALQEARTAGCSVVLTGDWGDHLWILRGAEWLRSLILSGRLGEATTSLARGVAIKLRGGNLLHPLRSALRGLVLPGRSIQTLRPRPWLTPYAQGLVDASSRALHASDTPGVLNGWTGRLYWPYELAHMNAAQRTASRHGIELRRPLQDRRLIEFFSTLPAHLVYRPAEPKRLLRRALSDRLPSLVLERRERTTLLGLAEVGLMDRAWQLVEDALDNPAAIWPRYVRREWIADRIARFRGSPRGDIEGLVVWHCYCLERWRESVDARGTRPS